MVSLSLNKPPWLVRIVVLRCWWHRRLQTTHFGQSWGIWCHPLFFKHTRYAWWDDPCSAFKFRTKVGMHSSTKIREIPAPRLGTDGFFRLLTWLFPTPLHQVGFTARTGSSSCAQCCSFRESHLGHSSLLRGEGTVEGGALLPRFAKCICHDIDIHTYTCTLYMYIYIYIIATILKSWMGSIHYIGDWSAIPDVFFRGA